MFHFYTPENVRINTFDFLIFLESIEMEHQLEMG